MTLRRRTLLGTTLALPLLQRSAQAARVPGTLSFGLSSYPPSLLPWNNAGTAAATVILSVSKSASCT